MNCVLYIIPLSWKKENIIRKIYKNLKLDIDISVLQSASIKTIGEYNINTMKRIFTLYFATINTYDGVLKIPIPNGFTLQEIGST